MGKLEYRQEGLAEMKPVIRESGGIDGVHHLSLMTLLIELVWEKGKTAMRRRSGHISQDGGLVHEDGKAVLAGAGGVGPGGYSGVGPAAGAQRTLGAAPGALKEDTRSGVEKLGMTVKLLIGVPEHGIILL